MELVTRKLGGRFMGQSHLAGQVVKVCIVYLDRQFSHELKNRPATASSMIVLCCTRENQGLKPCRVSTHEKRIWFRRPCRTQQLHMIHMEQSRQLQIHGKDIHRCEKVPSLTPCFDNFQKQMSIPYISIHILHVQYCRIFLRLITTDTPLTSIGSHHSMGSAKGRWTRPQGS